MNFLKPGNSVYVDNKNIGILLYECKEPKDTWAVLVKDKAIEVILIERYHINLIKSYKHRCWNCGISLDSSNDTTCPSCHWIKCPNCGKCHKPNCISDNIFIEDNNGCIHLNNGASIYKSVNGRMTITPIN